MAESIAIPRKPNVDAIVGKAEPTRLLPPDAAYLGLKTQRRGDGPVESLGIEEAARAYEEFRQRHEDAGGEALASCNASLSAQTEAADLFRDIHRSSPRAADCLARAALSMPCANSDFAGFQLLEELGRGAFGRVFLARQSDLANREVVLKVSPDAPAESQNLAQLQHTNIVPIYSAHWQGPFHALCMPYFGCTTLADVLQGLQSCRSLPVSGKHFVSTVNGRKKSTLAGSRGSSAFGERNSVAPGVAPPAAGRARKQGATAALEALEGFSYVKAVLWIGCRLADGLAHAHEQGILHRDLKPANVLLTDGGQPMLLDFNLAEDTKLRSTASAARVGGTLPYMSPEQLRAFGGGPPIDERSDLYSLGLILFELLTGRPAFPTRTGALHDVLTQMIEDRRQTPTGLRSSNRGVSPAAEAIVRRCLEFDPDRRYPSARALQQDLERHLAHLPLQHTPEPSLRERAVKWARRHPRLTSSTTIALLAALVLAMLPVVLASRQEHVRQLVALDSLNGFREQVGAAKFLLNKSGPDRRQLQEGAGLCEQALGRYHVLDDGSWSELPLVRNLPSEADRGALRREVHETLLTWARATALLAEQEPTAIRRQERAGFGLQLVSVAGSLEDGGLPSKAATLERAEFSRLLGHNEESRRLHEEADRLQPRTAREFYLLAMRLGDRREFDRALPLLREATRREPLDPWAWFYQGYCHQELGQDLDAVRGYTVSIALSPRLPTAYLPYSNRGLAYARLHQFAEACADFDDAIRIRPTSAEAFLNRGLARRDGGQFVEAIEDFDHALELDPSVTRLYFLRALARERNGDKAGACADRERGLHEEPTDELSFIDRGLARAATDASGALHDLDKALELNPRSLLALQNKAYVLAECLQRQKEAVPVLDRAVELYPGFVRARVGRGVVLARLGKREPAIADAREALARSSHPETFYQAANIYALTSRQEPEDQAEAFSLLAIALRGGFGLDLVDEDPDMAPIRAQPAFQRVVKAARDLKARELTHKP